MLADGRECDEGVAIIIKVEVVGMVVKVRLGLS